MPASPPPTRRVHLALRGLVQGVGFRPFVYRIALEQGLAGEVRNTSGGVELEVEGPPAAVEAMLHALRHRLPPLARLDQLELTELAPQGTAGFTIVESRAVAEGAALVSPDVATCDNCLREMLDPADRRFRYPFTNCTDCGPRFSIVRSVPYDRPLTTMRGFPLCLACGREYGDPLDRRFHAEPNACPVCGPRLAFLDGAGRPVPCTDPLVEAQGRLRQGQIVAVKGLGGYHLCCLAADEGAVRRLRERKHRPHKPLAVMARDLATARRACRIADAEAAELEGPRRPILLLKLRDDPDLALAPGLCPGHRTLGLMLPYTPLHHLLLQPDDLALIVATSGNRSGGPMVADDAEALAVLRGIADAFLVHDRPIANRCDDSVGFVEGGHTVLIRRSRGFVPLPVPLPRAWPTILALGAMLNDTFTLTEGARAFLSQHVGDTDDQDVLDFLEEAVAGLQRWLGVCPAVIAHDLHPDLFTTHLARRLAAEDGVRLVPVQHHHAHLAAVLAGAGHPGPATGLILDGTGYGPDGTIWGGEILVGDAGSVRRAGHLLPLPLPGGEAAVRRPWRIAVGWLHALLPAAAAWPLPLWERGAPGEATLVRQMVARRFNAPLTSSAGRPFDAVAALLGVAAEASYEGQAAMELEQVALGASQAAPLELELRAEGARLVLEPTPLLRGLCEGLLAGTPVAALALGFHLALARALVLCAVRIRGAGGPAIVALGGGVFHNRILTRACVDGLRAAGLEALAPGLIPVGDGGLSLGQALVAGAVLDGAPGRVEEE
ncbi:MAG: carbamoyltransferase HypF [Pseudomonadota bacterium]